MAVGIGLSIWSANGDPRLANQGTFFVMLTMCVGAGLLGPVLLRVTGPVARAFGGVGTLAADNLIVRAKALSGALVPLVLAVAFAAVKVVTRDTSAHVHGVPPVSASGNGTTSPGWPKADPT
jgi:putative ABC transport system permease protein